LGIKLGRRYKQTLLSIPLNGFFYAGVMEGIEHYCHLSIPLNGFGVHDEGYEGDGAVRRLSIPLNGLC